MSRSLMMRVVFGVLAVAVASIVMEGSAEAGLFRHRHKCCAEATCCEEAACCEEAPTCCEEEVIVEAPACECEPACETECEPACETECCQPKRRHCFNLFKRFKRNSCCEPACGC